MQEANRLRTEPYVPRRSINEDGARGCRWPEIDVREGERKDVISDELTVLS